jgi:hypothetical protein
MSSNRASASKAIALTSARGNTALYDALFTSLELLKDRPGRKAVVLLSDGVDDNGVGKQLSKHSVQDVLQFAKRVNAPIYAIGIGTEIDEALLAGFAQSTGGRYFLTPNASELKNLYDQIGIQLAGQYLISYTSNLPADGTTREVQVRYQDSMSAKSYQAPSNTLAESTPAPAASPTKKKSDGTGIGGLDTILDSAGIKLHGNRKQITVGGDGVSFSGDSNAAAENTPKANQPAPKTPQWLPMPEGAKGLVVASVAGQKQLVFTVDQPISEVAEFYQRQLSEQGLHVESLNSNAAQVLVVTGSGKNAKIDIAAQNENRTVVRIGYDE